MRGYLDEALFRVPSVESFLNNLITDIVNRRNLIVLLPFGIDPLKVWARLRTVFWQKDFRFEEIDLQSNSKCYEPVRVISETIGVTWPDPEIARSVQNLIKCPNLPDIIFLEGINRLNGEELKTWLDFIQHWSMCCQRVRNIGGNYPVLCAIFEGDSPLLLLPNSDVCLAVHWWWGFPSMLECQLLCRIAGENEDWNNVSIWREFIVPNLASNDVKLMENLWETLDININEIVKILLKYSEERGWNQENIRIWEGHLVNQQNPDLRDFKSSPPKRFQKLWANGALSYSIEQGSELHTAALAVLGDQDSINHRLWRGQTRAILPMLDSYRLEICRQLNNYFGPNWPTRWDLPKLEEDIAAVKENSFATSWGYLEYLLKYNNHFSGFHYLVPLVSISRSMRNKIAHYKPISYQDFNNLLIETHSLFSVNNG